MRCSTSTWAQTLLPRPRLVLPLLRRIFLWSTAATLLCRLWLPHRVHSPLVSVQVIYCALLTQLGNSSSELLSSDRTDTRHIRPTTDALQRPVADMITCRGAVCGADLC